MIRTRGILSVLALCGLLFAQSTGWHFQRDNPQTKQHVLTIDSKSFGMTKDPNTLRLRDMTARIYRSDGTVTNVTSQIAIVDLKAGTLRYGRGMSKIIQLRN